MHNKVSFQYELNMHLLISPLLGIQCNSSQYMCTSCTHERPVAWLHAAQIDKADCNNTAQPFHVLHAACVR